MRRYLSYITATITVLYPVLSFAHGDEADTHVEEVIPPSTDERTMVAIGLLILVVICAVGWVVIKKKSGVNKTTETASTEVSEK